MERLYWQCRRGMLELDELFHALMAIPLSEEEKKGLFLLMNESDDHLYRWFFEQKDLPDDQRGLWVQILSRKLKQIALNTDHLSSHRIDDPAGLS